MYDDEELDMGALMKILLRTLYLLLTSLSHLYSPANDDVHKSSVKKLRKNFEPRSDSDLDSEPDLESVQDPEHIPEPELTPDRGSSSSSSFNSLQLSMLIPLSTYIAASKRQPCRGLIDTGAAISGISAQRDLTNTINCNHPITPAFGYIIRATTEAAVKNPVLGQMNKGV